MKNKVIFPLLVIFIACSAAAFSQPGQGSQQSGQQRRSRGPVLIKDFEEPEEAGEKVYPHDPVAARKNMEVGQYYLKRKNYAAAEKRFSEAVEYDKTWAESYKKLIKVYDKQKKYDSAVDVCLKFSENNPESGEVDYFRKAEEKYRKKWDKEEKKKSGGD